MDKGNSFGRNIIPGNEKERLEALHSYNLNDLPDHYFTNLAHIVAAAFDAPIALISLVRENKVIFKGNAGMEDRNTEERGDSMCSLAILGNEPTVFVDSLAEPCLLTNPNVVGDFGLRFYAGAPITAPGGYNLGTVCIIDKHPRNFTEKEQVLLKRFAENAMHELEMRKSLYSKKYQNRSSL